MRQCLELALGRAMIGLREEVNHAKPRNNDDAGEKHGW